MLFFPWWVYLCIVGIIFSAYKLVAAAKEEEKVDQSFIEKEGQIYMERMEKERERRSSQQRDEENPNHSLFLLFRTV
ncbi:sporulation YhaL family protein [Bacillus inaquosorum]|uniref:sporulation YhaL family protein n=2 Tax=Bacillus inaquosorum TaxID=483913 RepID=UPI00228186AF|nr:sporulation YhaL family protein [Bacillus inaquosorum]MCY7950512.1 sporulation YhaL family protein [Bacillus inaquosorum]MCY8869226.1 sporulation YhaL family protein [Bacillus inaquosorum]MCY8996538.1 sporulation YhaL family protein [Bacillus inaquosorum]